MPRALIGVVLATAVVLASLAAGAAADGARGRPGLHRPAGELALRVGGRHHGFGKPGLRRGFPGHRGLLGHRGFRGKLRLFDDRLVLRFGDLDGFRGRFDRRGRILIPGFGGVDPIPGFGGRDRIPRLGDREGRHLGGDRLVLFRDREPHERRADEEGRRESLLTGIPPGFRENLSGVPGPLRDALNLPGP